MSPPGESVAARLVVGGQRKSMSLEHSLQRGEQGACLSVHCCVSSTLEQSESEK